MPLKIKLIAFAVVVLALNVCNLPGTDEIDSVSTAAMQTIQAQAAQDNSGEAAPTATGAAGQPAAPSSTSPPAAPSNTSPPPAPTNTPTPETACDLAGFVQDVTIPDGTKMSPGNNFTKTWRLINNGSCAWTSGYEIIFFGGDQMNGPGSQQLTNAIINPGQTIDISVNLTAPGSAGIYRGDWKLKNPSGQIFSLNGGIPFYVEIEVVEPTSTTHTVTLNQNDDGAIRSDGAFLEFPNVGDRSDNKTYQAFVQFNISGIPSNATITKIEVIFTDYDTVGNPFGSLGCLRSYVGNFFPLGAGDYISGNQGGALTRWCNTGELSSSSLGSDPFLSAMQDAVGGTYFELIIRFNDKETDNDSSVDVVRFTTLTLKITYTTP